MTDKEPFFHRLWADLKRRHVVRVAVGYSVVAWALVEVAEMILSTFDAPGWWLRAAVASAFLGFPIAVILAWVFDISDRQVVVTASRGLRFNRAFKGVLALPLIALVAASGWWVWSGYVAEKETSLRPTDLADRVPIIAVASVRNLTGDPELDWYGEGLANLIRDNLTRSRFLRIVSPQRWAAIVGEADTDNEIARRSQQEGIGFILAGEILETPQGLSVTSRLIDTEGGVQLSARQVQQLTARTLLTAAVPVAIQVKQSLNVPHAEQVDVFVADFATNNLAAYESYIAGLGFFLKFQYRKALRSFEAALELAPDFAVARYRLAYLQAVLGQTDAAVANMEQALESPALADREQRYLEAGLALFQRNYEQAVHAYESLLAEYPFEIEAREMLAKAYWGQYRAEDAVQQLEQLARTEPQNEVIWSSLGSYLLSMGEFERAQPALERFAALAPDNANSYALLGDSLRYRGQFDDALTQYEKALQLDPLMRDVAASLATIDYLRGDTASALTAFEQIAADERRPPRERLDAVFALAPLQAARGDYDAAIASLTRSEAALAEERIRTAQALSMRAVYEAHRGNPIRALQLVEESIALAPGVPTRYLYARGQLELLRGDYSAVNDTAAAIRSHALPADNPDRTEDKAAAYLEGLASLGRGDTETAIARLREATTLAGYAYGIYAAGLARAQLAAGDPAAASAALAGADEPALVDPRIDLEPERVRVLMLRARIARAAGDKATAARNARAFLERFAAAATDHPDKVEAAALAATND